VGTDLARRAPARPDALTPTLAPRVTRSLARFRDAFDFNQALNSWDTSSVTDMSFMWVLTSPARPDALTLTLAPRVARSLARQVRLRQELQSGPQQLEHEFGVRLPCLLL